MATIGYVDEIDFSAWLSARGITLAGSEVVALTKAFDFVELQNFKGTRTDSSQVSAWPRTGVYIDQVLIASDAFPPELLQLQMRVAVDIDSGIDPLAVGEQAVKSKRVEGAVSIEYQDGSGKSSVSSQTSALLGKLTKSSGFGQFEVYRG